MADIEEKLELMERRIRDLEDRMAIQQIIARYGPAVDSCSTEATANLWAADGSYDFGGAPLVGAEAVGKLVDLQTHRAYVARGCLHSMSTPVIEIDGDHAVATGNSRVYLHDGGDWKVERASANRWEFIRTVDGWRVTKRTNRLVDGSEEARVIFASGVDPNGTANPVG